MKIHGECPVGTGTRDQVGHQLGGDRDTAFVFAILPGVTVVGQNGRDPGSAGSSATVDHDQQFHQVLVDRRTRRLDQVDIPSADIFFDLALNFAIREIGQRNATQGQVEEFADLPGQRDVGSTAEYF